ncbi:MAG: hypothetical protein ACYDCN_16775 [Bacteroidia bacterium]
MEVVTEISISVIDKIGSKVSSEQNVRLLWAATLVGETINTSSLIAGALDIVMSFDTLPEKHKIALYLNWHKRQPNPVLLNEVTETINSGYDNILKSRSIRGKTKDHIVQLMKLERELKITLSEYKTAMQLFCENMKIAAFQPFTCTDSENWVNPLLIWHFPETETEKHSQERIKVVAETINDAAWFPLFDAIIKEQAVCADINSTKKKNTVQLISDLILEFPEPLTLSSGQLHLVRNDFSKTSWKFFEEMKKLNDELRQIPFTSSNFDKISSLYHEKATPLKAAMQQTADNNDCLRKLKNDEPAIKTYKLYAAIGSFNTVIRLYKDLNVIDESTALYVKESIGQRIDINNTRLFLFLEA